MIRLNDQLESVDGLAGLTTMADRLQIQGNPVLSDLDGLGALEVVWGDLDVRENPLLPYCEVCDLWLGLSALGGDLICHSNLQDFCWTGSEIGCL